MCLLIRETVCRKACACGQGKVIEWKRVYFAKGNRFSRSVCRYVGEAVHRRACAVLEEESLISKRASVEESCEFISVCLKGNWTRTSVCLTSRKTEFEKACVVVRGNCLPSSVCKTKRKADSRRACVDYKGSRSNASVCPYARKTVCYKACACSKGT